MAGIRHVLIPEVAEGVKQWAVGARDAEAMMVLATLFQTRSRIEAEVRPEFVPCDLTPEEATEHLARLKARPRTGAQRIVADDLIVDSWDFATEV